MSLHHYAEASPDARVMVAAGRIEREKPVLCALDNVQAMPLGDPLPELAAQGLHVHIWDGLMEGQPEHVQDSAPTGQQGEQHRELGHPRRGASEP